MIARVARRRLPRPWTLAFALGVFTGARQGWLQPVVKVTVVNQGGQPVTGLRLLFQGSGASGELVLPDLAGGGRTTARFVPGGEAAYRIRGRPLDERDGYAESGHVITEVLAPDGQKTVYQ